MLAKDYGDNVDHIVLPAIVRKNFKNVVHAWVKLIIKFNSWLRKAIKLSYIFLTHAVDQATTFASIGTRKPVYFTTSPEAIPSSTIPTVSSGMKHTTILPSTNGLNNSSDNQSPTTTHGTARKINVVKQYGQKFICYLDYINNSKRITNFNVCLNLIYTGVYIMSKNIWLFQ